MGFFSSDSSSSTTSNAYDQRQVNDAGGGIVGAGNSVSSNTSTAWTANTNNNIVSNDPAVIASITAMNAQMQGASAESMTDGVKALANMGTDVLKNAGASATSLNATSSANASAAWGHTVDASENVLTKAYALAGQSLQTSQAVATNAMATYQPPAAATGQATKWAALAAVGLVGVLLIGKLFKV